MGQPLRACTPLRPRSFTMDNAILEKANNVCQGAPTEKMRDDCLQGVDHSYRLYADGDAYILP